MSGIRSGVSTVHRPDPFGKVRPLIHYPRVCGGPDCRACEAEQELAEKEER